MKQVSHEKTNTVWLHRDEAPGVVTFTETERRKAVARMEGGCYLMCTFSLMGTFFITQKFTFAR